MRTPYLTPGLLGLFLLIALGWFFWKPSLREASVAVTGRAPAQAEGTATGNPPIAFGTSPFLTTHEQSTAFVPDGDNIAPSFHVEMEALKKRLAETPRDTTALIRLARLKQDGHQIEEAVTLYRRYLDLHPAGRQAWLDLTRCYGELERWPEALVATQSLLRQYPDDPSALYNLGAIYANTGRSGEARTTWERVAGQDGHPTMKTMAQEALRRLATMQHP